MRQFTVKKAEREKLKFSAMFMGATGSGKTAGALLVAKGIIQAMFPDLDDSGEEFWAKIGVIDTEHRRALIYADTTDLGTYIGRFLHLDFEAPYDVDGYIDAIQTLKSMGAIIVIVDSISHAWEDAGGILEVHSSMGGSFSAWRQVNPIIKKLYGAFTEDTDLHIITTARSKMKYDATTTEQGKLRVSKIGLKPIMRDDFEYEVLTAIHFDEDHLPSIIKDNTHIFEDGVMVTDNYGKELYHFLEKGVDINAQRANQKALLIKTIEDLIENPTKEQTAVMRLVERQAERKYNYDDWRKLSIPSLENVIEKLLERS